MAAAVVTSLANAACRRGAPFGRLRDQVTVRARGWADGVFVCVRPAHGARASVRSCVPRLALAAGQGTTCTRRARVRRTCFARARTNSVFVETRRARGAGAPIRPGVSHVTSTAGQGSACTRRVRVRRASSATGRAYRVLVEPGRARVARATICPAVSCVTLADGSPGDGSGIGWACHARRDGNRCHSRPVRIRRTKRARCGAHCSFVRPSSALCANAVVRPRVPGVALQDVTTIALGSASRQGRFAKGTRSARSTSKDAFVRPCST